METITMTGFNQQKRIDALKEALGYLQKAYNIIEDQAPENGELPDYAKNWIEAESKVSYVICKTTDAIGALIADDMATIYLSVPKTQLCDK